VLEKGEISLNMMLEQIADEFYALFEQKGMKCEISMEDDVYLLGDADRLARVFDNIIRNAISYSYEDTPIHITMRRLAADQVEIRVRNHGKEISPHKLTHIFEKFYRLDDSRSSGTGGAGLGLAIAKEIVELHQGTIEAVSNERYTEFIVVLPCLKDTPDHSEENVDILAELPRVEERKSKAKKKKKKYHYKRR
jgi:two-component system sensor histidine kinase VanS